MPRKLQAVIRHLRHLAAVSSLRERSDAELLYLYVAEREEEAFGVLAHRHGALIYAVCRRVLRREEDVEDAVQATLLVLARKAAGIRKRQALASWLHGVAYRIALNAKKSAARRELYERQAEVRAVEQPLRQAMLRELQEILDAEVRRLPEKYRAPFALCYLEGKSKSEAARELGWKEGTVSGRLAQARERLRRNLARRGLGLSAALCALALSRDAESARIPTAMIQGILTSANGKVGGVSLAVSTLAESGLQTMGAVKLRWTLALMLAGTLTVFGAGLTMIAPPTARQPDAPPSERKTEEPTPRTDLYGDPLPQDARARLGTVRLRQDRRLDSAPKISPDGKTLATDGDGGLRLWSMSTGKLVWFTKEMTRFPMFAPDGKLLAASDGPSVGLLDATTGRLVRRIPTNGHVLAFSPDGKRVATTSDDRTTVCLWEIETGRHIVEMKGHKRTVRGAAFEADGRTLITADFANAIYRWDATEGKLQKSFDTAAPQARNARFSPDGRTLAVVPYSREAVRLYDTDTGKLRCVLQGAPAACRYGLAFSPDSRTLATDWAGGPWGEQATISLWDAANGKPLRRFTVPSGDAISLCLAPDGRTVVSGGNDAACHVWDSVTGKPLLEWPAHTGPINALAFTPDGRQLVSFDYKTLRLWEVSTARHLRELRREPDEIRDLAIAPDGRSVFSGGYLATWLLELPTGKEQRRFPLDEEPEKIPKPDPTRHGHSARYLGLSADERTAVCISTTPRKIQPDLGGQLYEVYVWDRAGGGLLVHRELGTQIDLLGITPGATATIESVGLKRIVLREIRTGKHLVTLSQPDTLYGNAYAVSPDGRTLVTMTGFESQNGKKTNWGPATLRFWELASGKERQTITSSQPGLTFAFRKVAFTSDGQTVATVRDDRILQIWDTVGGKEKLHRKSSDSEVKVMAFAPDGQTLATGHDDSTILLWDTTSPKKAEEQPSREADAKEPEQCWSALAGDDAHAAWTAIWKMVAAPRRVLPLLRQRLKPVEPFPADEAERLLEDLDSDDFAKREAASHRLAELGDRVVPALRNALKAAPSLEKRRRIENLLPNSDVVRSLQVLRVVRAIEVLEHIGTAEAQGILKTLAQGMTEARITREAKASLQRLTKHALVKER